MNCLFCKNIIELIDLDLRLKCMHCTTSDVRVVFTKSVTRIYYKSYQIEINTVKNLTYIFQDEPFEVLALAILDGCPLNPSNIKDKLNTFLLLS